MEHVRVAHGHCKMDFYCAIARTLRIFIYSFWLWGPFSFIFPSFSVFLYWFNIFSHLTHTASSGLLSQSLSLNQPSIELDHQSIPSLFLIFLYLRSSFCLINRFRLISTLSHPPPQLPNALSPLDVLISLYMRFPQCPLPLPSSPRWWTPLQCKCCGSSPVRLAWQRASGCLTAGFPTLTFRDQFTCLATSMPTPSPTLVSVCACGFCRSCAQCVSTGVVVHCVCARAFVLVCMFTSLYLLYLWG